MYLKIIMVFNELFLHNVLFKHLSLFLLQEASCQTTILQELHVSPSTSGELIFFQQCHADHGIVLQGSLQSGNRQAEKVE